MNYEQEIEDRYAALRKLQAEISRLEQQWIQAECPVRIGDHVEVNGISYQGQPMEVSRITIADWAYQVKTNYAFHVFGQVLKKNGEPGKNEGESYYPAGKKKR